MDRKQVVEERKQLITYLKADVKTIERQLRKNKYKNVKIKIINLGNIFSSRNGNLKLTRVDDALLQEKLAIRRANLKVFDRKKR